MPFMNVNTKNPQLDNCPCPKYGAIHRFDLYNLHIKKTSGK